MEWLLHPTEWLGFFTLILLEVVLGIDNLIFIAVLTNKLPPEQRSKAHNLGLGLALVMRIALLFVATWLVHLSDPLIQINGKDLSGRDLIFIIGGMFLLFKATMELHERMEGGQKILKKGEYSSFWLVIAQIILLDAVFSIDSVLTAVGMATNLSMMITAVIFAVIIMMIASKPLTTFISLHPTFIVLCLGFIILIGCNLIIEGFGIHVPKAYLYSAIIFSLTIEIFNLIVRSNRKKILVNDKIIRERVSEAIQHLLGVKTNLQSEDLVAIAGDINRRALVFNPDERAMMQSILRLSDISIKTITIPYNKVYSLDINCDEGQLKEGIHKSVFSKIIICDGLIKPLGYIHKNSFLNIINSYNKKSFQGIIQKPIIVTEDHSILRVLENLRKNNSELAFVKDIAGNIIGIVTLMDIVEFII